MKLKNKYIPFGALPYDKENLVTQMMVRLFEQVPYLPLLPKIVEDETLLSRTIKNLSWFVLHNNKILLKDDSEKFKKEITLLDKTLNAPYSADEFERYKINSFYWDKYIEIINRINPDNAVINLLGPFSLSQMIYKAGCPQVLADKVYCKTIVQSICAKAVWAVKKICDASPNTTPIVILEEPLLNKIGSVLRDSKELTRNILVDMFAEIVQKLHEYGSIVGIQCFIKCDWQVAIDAKVDLISFDAYNNPNNLGIIAEKVNNFLIAGGYINWGIIPAKTTEQINSLTVDYLMDKFNNTITETANQGVNFDLLMKRSTVSIQQDLTHLPLVFVEKVLMLNNQLAQRLSSK